MTHFSHCALRLGDNLAALQLIRALAKANPDRKFVHACPFGYMNLKANLAPVVQDLPNVRLVDISATQLGSVDLWKGGNGWFYQHPRWQDYVTVMLDFYALASVRIGLPCPITTRREMLFDYPALKEAAISPGLASFDWLVVNSVPLSGQLPGYNVEEMDRLVLELSKKYWVATTAPTSHGQELFCAHGLGITDIGAISMAAKNILMVSTGPSWTTFNVWTEETIKTRIILLNNERITLGRNTLHSATVEGARTILLDAGIL